MKLNFIFARALASFAVLSLTSINTQSAPQPELGTAGVSLEAVYTGGGTISAGANYLGEVPSSEKLDLVATVKPAPNDVGKIGTLIAIVQVEGIGIYTKLPLGGWVAFDINNLQGFATKTLAPSESCILYTSDAADE